MARILAVDDDENTLLFVRKILESHGHKVITAPNGVKGLKKASWDRPDLIIADIMMPDMDGLEMLERLKDPKGSTWTIPVIMLTGVNSPEAMQTAMYNYSEYYLAKPFDEGGLMDVVSAVLALKKPEERSPGLLKSVANKLMGRDQGK